MGSDIDRIREALQFIPVGGHDERVRVAFMLKSGLGESGRALWDEWCDGRGDDEAASVWKSASETGPLQIGTLFHEAKANGWRDDGRYVMDILRHGHHIEVKSPPALKQAVREELKKALSHYESIEQ